MRKYFALLLILLSVIPFYFTYKTATKEIGRTSIIGSDKAYTRIYTPFDYQQSNQDQYLNNVIGNYLGNGNAGDENQDFLEKQAKKYQNITFIWGFWGILLFVIGLSVILHSKTSTEEPIINSDEDSN